MFEYIVWTQLTSFNDHSLIYVQVSSLKQSCPSNCNVIAQFKRAKHESLFSFLCVFCHPVCLSHPPVFLCLSTARPCPLHPHPLHDPSLKLSLPVPSLTPPVCYSVKCKPPIPGHAHDNAREGKVIDKLQYL